MFVDIPTSSSINPRRKLYRQNSDWKPYSLYTENNNKRKLYRTWSDNINLRDMDYYSPSTVAELRNRVFLCTLVLYQDSDNHLTYWNLVPIQGHKEGGVYISISRLEIFLSVCSIFQINDVTMIWFSFYKTKDNLF